MDGATRRSPPKRHGRHHRPATGAITGSAGGMHEGLDDVPATRRPQALDRSRSLSGGLSLGGPGDAGAAGPAAESRPLQPSARCLIATKGAIRRRSSDSPQSRSQLPFPARESDAVRCGSIPAWAGKPAPAGGRHGIECASASSDDRTRHAPTRPRRGPGPTYHRQAVTTSAPSIEAEHDLRIRERALFGSIGRRLRAVAHPTEHLHPSPGARSPHLAR